MKRRNKARKPNADVNGWINANDNLVQTRSSKIAATQGPERIATMDVARSSKTGGSDRKKPKPVIMPVRPVKRDIITAVPTGGFPELPRTVSIVPGEKWSVFNVFSEELYSVIEKHKDYRRRSTNNSYLTSCIASEIFFEKICPDDREFTDATSLGMEVTKVFPLYRFGSTGVFVRVEGKRFPEPTHRNGGPVLVLTARKSLAELLESVLEVGDLLYVFGDKNAVPLVDVVHVNIDCAPAFQIVVYKHKALFNRNDVETELVQGNDFRNDSRYLVRHNEISDTECQIVIRPNCPADGEKILPSSTQSSHTSGGVVSVSSSTDFESPNQHLNSISPSTSLPDMEDCESCDLRNETRESTVQSVEDLDFEVPLNRNSSSVEQLPPSGKEPTSRSLSALSNTSSSGKREGIDTPEFLEMIFDRDSPVDVIANNDLPSQVRGGYENVEVGNDAVACGELSNSVLHNHGGGVVDNDLDISIEQVSCSACRADNQHGESKASAEDSISSDGQGDDFVEAEGSISSVTTEYSLDGSVSTPSRSDLGSKHLSVNNESDSEKAVVGKSRSVLEDELLIAASHDTAVAPYMDVDSMEAIVLQRCAMETEETDNGRENGKQGETIVVPKVSGETDKIIGPSSTARIESREKSNSDKFLECSVLKEKVGESVSLTRNVSMLDSIPTVNTILQCLAFDTQENTVENVHVTEAFSEDNGNAEERSDAHLSESTEDNSSQRRDIPEGYGELMEDDSILTSLNKNTEDFISNCNPIVAVNTTAKECEVEERKQSPGFTGDTQLFREMFDCDTSETQHQDLC